MFYSEMEEDMDFEEDTEDEQWTQTLKDDTMHGKVPAEVSHDRVIVHIDIDCFYAQVEMISDPSLQDKPLGIQQKNILVTCNYVARQHGLTKLMYLKDAQQKCPQLVIRNGEDLTKYRDMSAKIFNVLQQYSPLVEKLGMDENFVDVTAMLDVPPWNNMADKAVEGHVYGASQQAGGVAPCPCGCRRRLTIASHICQEMRRALHAELGITSCGGVGHNKLLAKVVGAQNKPNDQTVLFPGQERALIESLGSVRKVPGIGHAMSKTLGSLGVLSVADLAERPLEELSRSLGHHTAQRLQQLAQGIDLTTVTPTGKPQSMSDEDSFKKCATVPDFKSRTSDLLSSLLRRLLTDGRFPATLRLTLRKFDPNRKYFGRESRQCPLPASMFHHLSAENLKKLSVRLLDLCLDLFHKMIDSGKPFHLTLINVCFTKFSDTPQKKGIGAYLKQRERKEKDDEHADKVGGETSATESSTTLTKSSANRSIAAFLHGGIIPGSADKTVDRNAAYQETNTILEEKRSTGLQKNVTNQQKSPAKLNCDKASNQELSSDSSGVASHQQKSNHSQCAIKGIGKFLLQKSCEEQTGESSGSCVGTKAENETNLNIEPQSTKKSVLITPTTETVKCLGVSELPEEVDMDTFKELPKDIQQEILSSQHVVRSNPHHRQHAEVSDQHQSTEVSDQLQRTEVCDQHGSTVVSEQRQGAEASEQRQGTEVTDQQQSTEASEQEQSTKDITSGVSDKEVGEQPTKIAKTDRKRSLDEIDSPHSSNSLHSSVREKFMSTSNSPHSKLPQGIDPSVFSQLPPDVQKSVLSEHHAQNVQKEFAGMKTLKSPLAKKAKKSRLPQANISSFFAKK